MTIYAVGQRSARIARRMGVVVALVLSVAGAGAQTTKPAPSNPQLASPEIERRVNALLAKMTLEEKLGQLVQYNTVGAMSATVAAGQEADLATNPEANYHLDPMQLAPVSYTHLLPACKPRPRSWASPSA